ncbi:MAG TPA: ABC transporter permease [Polyangia bacterium]
MRLQLLVALFCREAVRALLRHKLRSALTTLGIMIGIAAVVLVVAVGQAGSTQVQSELQKLGDNLVWVEAGSRNIAGVRNGSHGTTSLTIEDAEAIRRDVPLIKRLSPQVDGGVHVIANGRNWTTRYRGETPDYLAIKKWDLTLGSSFSDEDVRDAASKVLIGQTVRKELFGDADPIGQIMQINGGLFEIVGVLVPKGQNGDGRDQDDWLLLPYTTAEKKIRGGGLTWLDDILCSAVSPEAVNPAIDRIVELLRDRHGIRAGDPDDFNIRRPDEVLKAQLDAANVLTLLLVSIASISLLVGGIGIMNVMLASVAQRTREIGVRLAIGARASAVELQFLGEAFSLAVIGGIIGVGMSFAGRIVFESTLGWPIAISPTAVVVAIAASAGVGAFFGYWPARRASRLDPIAALRHE